MDPATTNQTAQTQGDYTIPQVVLDKYPDLVELIKKTESMTVEERNYWFQILPIMTVEQVERLKKILLDEASQLAKLDDQYQAELSKLNEKHLEEWNLMEKNKQKEEIKAKEKAEEAGETKAQEDLLNKLNEA